MQERPAEFDRDLAAYMPMLGKLGVRFFGRGDNAHDFAQGAALYALASWRSYKPAFPFPVWLKFKAREYAAARRKKQYVPTVTLKQGHDAPVNASQDSAVYLSQVIAMLSGIKHGDALLRKANGDSLADISGETAQVMHERIKRARAKLLLVAA